MDIYFAIAEPNRRLILEHLARNGFMAAGEVAEKFQITAQAVSQHLKILFQAGLVKQKRHGRKKIYYLNKEGVTELDEWISFLKDNWEERLTNLETYLENNP